MKRVTIPQSVWIKRILLLGSFLYLLHNPEIKRKVQKEIDMVIIIQDLFSGHTKEMKIQLYFVTDSVLTIFCILSFVSDLFMINVLTLSTFYLLIRVS